MRICPHCGERTEVATCPTDGLPTISEELLTQPDEGLELAGKVLGGRYRIGGLLGRGGMSAVFRATHLAMQNTVAVKVLRRGLILDLAAIRRFYQEARACSLLKQHHTIKVFDFGISDEGYPYLVMECLEGRTLASELATRGPLPPALAMRIARQICLALDEAHEVGLVHRDLKPSNIFLCRMPGEQDYVKVLDFGIAKFVAGDPGEPLTHTGIVMGTPEYLSPEQASDQPLDRRSDLYALGVILHEMLTGRAPFKTSSPATTLMMHVREPPPPLPLAVAGIPVPLRLRQLIQDLLAKAPDDRPGRAAEVGSLLDELAAATPAETLTGAGGGLAAAPARPAPAAVRPRRWPWLLGGLALLTALAGAGGGAWYALHPPPPSEQHADTGSPGQLADRASASRMEPEPATAPPAALPPDLGPPAQPEPPRPPDPADHALPSLPVAAVEVRVSSTPTGALLKTGGQVLGRTPLPVRVSPAEPLPLQLTHPHHRTLNRLLTAEDAPQLHLTLSPLPPPPADAKAGSAAAPAKLNVPFIP